MIQLKKEQRYYGLIMRLDYNSEDLETLDLVNSKRKYFFFFVLGWSSFAIPITFFILVINNLEILIFNNSLTL